jgi:hypothetical protein
MALVSISIPNLISGVSQQADALRFASQAEESINAYPSLVDGLIKRPSTNHVAGLLTGSTTGAKWHTINRDSGERYTVVFNPNSSVRVWDMNGVEKTVVTRANAFSYIPATANADLKCLSVADYTLILNKTKVVQEYANLTPTRPYEAMIFVAQGAYTAEYQVTINGTSHWVKTGSGNGTTNPSASSGAVTSWVDADDANTTKIAFFLRQAISSDANLTTEVIGSTIYIRRTNNAAFTISVSDSQSGTGLKLINDEVQSFLDLPAEGKHGFIVKVAGEPDDEGDEYWVQFDASNGTGGTGVWKETVQPGIRFALDESTLPHALIRLQNGSFLFTPLDGDVYTAPANAFTYQIPYWGERLIGDVESNPSPSFVSRSIKDILFFRNRLGFLCDENVVLSEASEFFNFFRTTVTQLLDSDPIDVASSSNKVSILFAGLPFNEKLLLFSDQTQFSLQSADNLTSKTVSIQNTTNFSCSTTSQPVAVGKNIYFAFNRDSFSGIQEYYLNPESQYLDGVDVSASIPSYIKGTVSKIVGSDNEQMIVVMSSGLKNGFYMYKYFFNGSEKLQSAWCKFTIGADPDDATATSGQTTIENVDFIDNKLYVVTTRGGSTFLERIDFQSNKTDAFSAYSVLLDRKVSSANVSKSFNSNTGLTTFTLPYAIDPAKAAVITRATTFSGPGYSPQSVGGQGGQQAITTGIGGAVVPVNSVAGALLTVKGDYSTVALWLGENYTMEHTLGRVVVRAPGSRGNPTVVSVGKLYLRRASISYDKTRTFKVRVVPINNVYPTTYEYVCNNQSAGTPTAAVNFDSLRDGTFKFPILSKNDQVLISLVNDSPHPCALLSLDVEAQYVSRSQRAG